MSLLLLGLVLAYAPTLPQTRQRSDVVVPPGGQVAQNPTAKESEPQITNEKHTGRVEQVGSVDRRSVVQIAPATRRATGQSQLNDEQRGSGGTPQLSRGSRSVAAPQPVASLADGRHTEVVRVGGNDRCDPQSETATSERCAHIIEKRSAQFSSPTAPVLSPEERLLLQHDVGPRNVRMAVQRAARNDVDPDARDTQALAAVGLGQRPDPAIVTGDGPSPEGMEAIGQIIEAAQALQPKQ